jgi:hypothetical protein
MRIPQVAGQKANREKCAGDQGYHSGLTESRILMPKFVTRPNPCYFYLVHSDAPWARKKSAISSKPQKFKSAKISFREFWWLGILVQAVPATGEAELGTEGMSTQSVLMPDSAARNSNVVPCNDSSGQSGSSD